MPATLKLFDTNGWTEEQLRPFAGISEPGTALWIYGWPTGFAATAEGFTISPIQQIFGGTESVNGQELCPPLLAVTSDEDGTWHYVSPLIAVARGDAEMAWHVFDQHELIVAGGPSLDEHCCRAIAARRGTGHTVRQGLR